MHIAAPDIQRVGEPFRIRARIIGALTDRFERLRVQDGQRVGEMRDDRLAEKTRPSAPAIRNTPR